MSSSSNNDATPVLLTKETIPREMNVYHRLEPHLLNGTLIYKIKGTNNFVPASLLSSTTGAEIVQALQDDPVANVTWEDKVLDMMKSEAGTNIITDVYNQARYEETHRSDEEDDAGDTKMAAVDETAVVTLPAYCTTPPKIPTTITTMTASQVVPSAASLPAAGMPTGKSTRSRTIRPGIYRFVKQTQHGDVPPVKTVTVRHDAKWHRIKTLPEKQRKKAYRDWEISQHHHVLAKNLDPFLHVQLLANCT